MNKRIFITIPFQLLLLEKTKHYDVKKYANAGMSENQDPASVEIRANANVNTSKIIGIYSYAQSFSFLDGSAYITKTA
jgi:hypothetical protein